MNGSVESRAVEKFRERLNSRNLTGVRLTHRVAGGMPGEGRTEEEVVVLGTNQAITRSVTPGGASEEASIHLDQLELITLFEQIEQAITGLVPRSEARFPPDSVIGSLTIELNGEQATFYYMADEEQRKTQNQFLAPNTSEALTSLSKLSKRALDEKDR
jgi:hypothetical protein